MSGIVVIGAVFLDIKGHSRDTYIPKGRNVGSIHYVHGGVSRNVVEDIANVELRPTFISLVDDTPNGEAILQKLRKHKVETKYIKTVKDGMGIWLAVFDHQGDVVASVSSRPDLLPLVQTLDEYGDEIFENADSICIEIDIEKDIINRVFKLAEKHHKEVYALVSNMSIALQRRDFIKSTGCFVCNEQEAGMFFSEDYSNTEPAEMAKILSERVQSSQIKRMVVTMGSHGSVYADCNGEYGFYPALKVNVIDTTGAGDSFFSGVAIGLTYGKTLKEACAIGTKLASSVITSHENVCPRFLPQEFDLTVSK